MEPHPRRPPVQLPRPPRHARRPRSGERSVQLRAEPGGAADSKEEGVMRALQSRALAALIVLSALQAAAAQPTTADVEKLIKHGNELRTDGKDQQALAFFQKAYEI